MCMSVQYLQRPEEALHLLELELLVDVRGLALVLGTGFGSSARAGVSLNG